MLESPYFLISRALHDSLGHESNWLYTKFRLMELSCGKRRLDDLAEISARKSSKPLEESMFDLNELPPSDIDTLSKDDKPDPTALFYHIGRDNSFSYLLRCSRSDYGVLALLNRNFRSLIRSGELYRLRRQMDIVEYWVYFSCSLHDWEVFDPTHLRWMYLPRMPKNECFMYSDKESLAVGTQLLVFGKDIMLNVMYKYDFFKNWWSLGAEMNWPRCLFASARIFGIAIITGGCDPRGNITNVVEIYNSDTETWVPIPSMRTARKICSRVIMDGKFYVIGGIGVGNSDLLTCAKVYDFEAKTWTEIPNMFPAQEYTNM